MVLTVRCVGGTDGCGFVVMTGRFVWGTGGCRYVVVTRRFAGVLIGVCMR